MSGLWTVTTPGRPAPPTESTQSSSRAERSWQSRWTSCPIRARA